MVVHKSIFLHHLQGIENTCLLVSFLLVIYFSILDIAHLFRTFNFNYYIYLLELVYPKSIFMHWENLFRRFSYIFRPFCMLEKSHFLVVLGDIFNLDLF